MANPVAAQIVNAVSNPFPSVLNNLQNINSQLNFAISQLDSASTYGTLTAARPNPKPFIIGFIPPDNPINFVPIQSSPTQIAAINQVSSKDKPNKSAADLPDEFFTALQQVAQNTKSRPQDLIALMYNEGSAHGQNIVSDAVNIQNGHPVAKGLIQFTKDSLKISGLTLDQWNNLQNTGPISQLQYVQNYFTSVSGGRPYTSYQQLYLANFTGEYYPDPTTLDPNTVLWPAGSLQAQQNKAFSDGGTGPVTVGNILNATKTVPYTQGVQTIVNRYNDVTSGTTPAPAITGNDDDAARGLMIYSNSYLYDDPLQNALGRNITVANAQRQALALKQTQALQAQIQAVAATPPLILLVNPKEFKRNYEQSTDDSPTTRYGHIVHRWLEKPLSISCSGVTAGQYILDASGNGGITNFYRVHSLSYQNLLSLLGIYKNNGVIFAGPESDPGIPIIAMSLFIYYDNHIYIGSFDDFGITDSGEKPYNMEYSFKFTVRYDVELDSMNQTLDFSIVNQLQTGTPSPATRLQSQVQINQVPPEAANFAGFGTPGNAN